MRLAYLFLSMCVLSALSCECKIFFLHFLSVDDSLLKAELTFYRSLGIPYLCNFSTLYWVYANVHSLYIQTSELPQSLKKKPGNLEPTFCSVAG